MKESRRYESAAVGAPVRVRRRIPTRAPSIAADVGVPVLSGLILGAIAAIMPALLLSAIVQGPFWAAWIGFASVFCTVAILWRLGVIDKSLWATENIVTTRPDRAEGLEMPALPEPADRVVLLGPYAGRERLEADKRQEQDHAFAEFVQGCEEDTRARTWEPRIGRVQYKAWQSALRESGWADDKTDNQKDGWQLTASAATICDALDL